MNILEQFYILFKSDADEAQKKNEALEASAVHAAGAIDATATANQAAAAAASQSASAGVAGAAAVADGMARAKTAIIGEADAHMIAYRAAKMHGDAETYAAKRVGLNANEMLNLTRQFADVGVTAAMGMSPFMIAIQQGPQIADAFQMAAARGVKFGDALAGIGAAAAKLLPILGGLALPLTIIGGLAIGSGIAKGQVESLTALGDAATKLGDTVEDVDALTRAIRDNGGTSKAAMTQLDKFADHLSDAFGNHKSAAGKALAGLGMSAGDAKGVKATSVALVELAGHLEHVSQSKAAATLKALGITDDATTRLVMQGSAAVEARIAAEKALGVTTAEQVARAQKYKQEVQRLNDVMTDLRNMIAATFLPMLTATTRAFREVAEWVSHNRTLVQGFGVAALIAIAVVSAAIWSTWVPAFTAAAVAVIAATWPILLIGAAVAGLAAIFAACYEDVMFFLKGQPSLLGELVNKYGWVKAAVHAIGDAFKWLGREGAAAWEAIKSGAVAIGHAIARAFVAAGPALRGLWAVLGPVLSFIWDAVKALAPVLWWAFVVIAKEAFRQWKDIFALFGVGARGIAAAFGLAAKIIGPIWDEMFKGWLQQLYLLIHNVRRLFHMKPDATVDAALAGQGGAPSPPPTAPPGLGAGQSAVNFAARVPFAALGQSPMLGARGPTTKTTHVDIAKVDVHTQATDADGIAAAFSGSLGNELRRASLNFDDGIDR